MRVGVCGVVCSGEQSEQSCLQSKGSRPGLQLSMLRQLRTLLCAALLLWAHLAKDQGLRDVHTAWRAALAATQGHKQVGGLTREEGLRG